jgi:hypothetical protein
MGWSALAIQELEPERAGDLPSPSPSPPWHTRLPAFFNRPALSGLLALLATTAFALGRWQRWSRGNVASWILVGQKFAGPGLAHGIALRGGTGYDGQFYYRLAMNPADLSSTGYGITFDVPYRLIRIGYPALVWLASLGHGSLVPMMLVAVNVAAMAAMGLFGAMLARDGGYHALCGLLVPMYFGLVTSIARDTAEPVACAFLLAGLVAIRRGRPVLAGIMLAGGVLTRETVLVAVAAIAVVRCAGLIRARQRADLDRARPGRADLAWLLPAIAFPAWEVVCRIATGNVPLLTDGDQNAGTPFVAAFDAVRHNVAQLSWTGFSYIDDWVLEFAVLVIVAMMALCCLRRSRAPLHERVALVAYLVEICVVTPSTWNSVNADLRSFVEVYLMAIIVLLGVPRKRGGVWLLCVAAAWAVPTLYLTGMHRLTWS